jgi:hypothetical protein
MRTDLSQFFEQLRALLITMKRNEP